MSEKDIHLIIKKIITEILKDPIKEIRDQKDNITYFSEEYFISILNKTSIELGVNSLMCPMKSFNLAMFLYEEKINVIKFTMSHKIKDIVLFGQDACDARMELIALYKSTYVKEHITPENLRYKMDNIPKNTLIN